MLSWIIVVNKIAYFDLDNSLANYEKAVLQELECLRSPAEEYVSTVHGWLPDHIFRRKSLITSSLEFWVNLEPIPLGFEVLNICKEIGYKIVVLTCCPKTKPNAATGKLLWCQKHLCKDIDFKIVSQKNIDYGSVLYDDFPEYMDEWFKLNKDGLGLMPNHDYNQNYSRHNVHKVDNNISFIKNILINHFENK